MAELAGRTWFQAGKKTKLPTPGIEPGPRRWERRILTTRPYGRDKKVPQTRVLVRNTPEPHTLVYSTVGCRRICCRRTARLEFPDFLRTCQARSLRIGMAWIIIQKMCAKFALCTSLKQTALISDKNVNRPESRKLRTAPGYDTGPHVLRHPTVL